MYQPVVLALGAIVFLIATGLLGAPQSTAASGDAPVAHRDPALAAFGALNARGGNAGPDYNAVIAPPETLPRQSRRHDDGRIVVAQSKKEISQGIASNTLRVEQMQEQIRQLTGQVEQLLFEMQRMQEQIRLMQEDSEARFQVLEGSAPPEGAATGGKRSDIGVLLPEDHARADTPAEAGSGGTDADLLGPTAAAGVAQPLDLGASVRAGNAGGGALPPAAQPGNPSGLPASHDPLLQPNGVASLGTLRVSPDNDPDGLYNLGYTQLLNGDYEAAEQNLRKFVELYPSHPLVANSRYWLGETYYARGRFSEAVEEFSNSYKTYPNSPKAPDSLLKLGLSLAQLQERDAACATLAEMLNRFPNASRSIQIAAQDERARSNCS